MYIVLNRSLVHVFKEVAGGEVPSWSPKHTVRYHLGTRVHRARWEPVLFDGKRRTAQEVLVKLPHPSEAVKGKYFPALKYARFYADLQIAACMERVPRKRDLHDALLCLIHTNDSFLVKEKIKEGSVFKEVQVVHFMAEVVAERMIVMCPHLGDIVELLIDGEHRGAYTQMPSLKFRGSVAWLERAEETPPVPGFMMEKNGAAEFVGMGSICRLSESHHELEHLPTRRERYLRLRGFAPGREFPKPEGGELELLPPIRWSLARRELWLPGAPGICRDAWSNLWRVEQPSRPHEPPMLRVGYVVDMERGTLYRIESLFHDVLKHPPHVAAAVLFAQAKYMGLDGIRLTEIPVFRLMAELGAHPPFIPHDPLADTLLMRMVRD